MTILKNKAEHLITKHKYLPTWKPIKAPELINIIMFFYKKCTVVFKHISGTNKTLTTQPNIHKHVKCA